MERHSNLVKLGKQLRGLRKAAGYSQESFALTVGIARAYYGGVERGERNIAALNLIKIAKALDVEVGQLFPHIQDLE